MLESAGNSGPTQRRDCVVVTRTFRQKGVSNGKERGVGKGKKGSFVQSNPGCPRVSARMHCSRVVVTLFFRRASENSSGRLRGDVGEGTSKMAKTGWWSVVQLSVSMEPSNSGPAAAELETLKLSELSSATADYLCDS